MIDLAQFTQGIEDCFINGGVKLTPTTWFRKNDEFDSLIGFTMLVYMEDTFGYRMSVDDFLLCNTPEDLYKRIKEHLS